MFEKLICVEQSIYMAKPQITCLDFFKGLAPIFDETSLQTSELVNVSFQTSGL
jgi:hypothetical protein